MRDRGLLWYILASALLTLVVVVAGLTGFPTGQLIGYGILGVLAAGAMAAGVLRHRPAPRRPWLFLVAAQLCYLAGAEIVLVSSSLLGTFDLQALANVFFAVMYLCTLTGLALISRRRTPGWAGFAVLDAAVIVTSATLLAWVYLIAPVGGIPGTSAADRLTLTAFIVVDLLEFAVAARIALDGGRRTTSLHLLLGSLAMQVFSDCAFLLQRLHGDFSQTSWVPVTYLIGLVLLTGSAVHPSMRRVAEPVAHRSADVSPARLVLLAAASLIAPGVLIERYLAGDLHPVPVIAGATALLCVLVVGRMGGIVLTQRRLATSDALTRLPNRRWFDDRLSRTLGAGRPVAVAIIDVDFFKSVNDTYGHDCGDDVLASVAGRLRSAARSADVVARYGGEEFAVFMPETGAEQAWAAADRLREAVAAHLLEIRTGERLRVTVSAGVAVSEAAESPATVMRRADTALYSAKENGRNRSVVAAYA